MKVKFKVILFCLMASSFISCDQLTKNIAREQLMNKQPASYFHDLFRLEYAENTGAALSLGANLPQPYNFLLLGILPLLVMMGLLIYALSTIKQLDLLRLSAFALVFAGGIGNLIDRLFNDRHVTDFMNLGIQNLRTGIFNVADVCITAGVIALFISYHKTNSNQANPKLV